MLKKIFRPAQGSRETLRKPSARTLYLVRGYNPSVFLLLRSKNPAPLAQGSRERTAKPSVRTLHRGTKKRTANPRLKRYTLSGDTTPQSKPAVLPAPLAQGSRETHRKPSVRTLHRGGENVRRCLKAKRECAHAKGKSKPTAFPKDPSRRHRLAALRRGACFRGSRSPLLFQAAQ